MLEVFSGSGNLTCEVRRVGLRESTGIDHKVHQRVRAPTVKLDLAKPSDQAVFQIFLHDPNLIYIHWAPPCGTASGPVISEDLISIRLQQEVWRILLGFPSLVGLCWTKLQQPMHYILGQVLWWLKHFPWES
jgi:hypothetical protein